MIAKRIIGIVVFIIGVAMIIVSISIKKQTEAGKTQIAGAQKKVEQGNSLFSLSPVTKGIGQGVTGSAQKKINAGKEQVAQYETIAQWLLIGGIILCVVGAGIVFIGKKKIKK
jgi:hypothetical protein